MKTASLLLIFVLSIFTTQSFAASSEPGKLPSSDPFALDESKAYQAVGKLTELEQYLIHQKKYPFRPTS